MAWTGCWLLLAAGLSRMLVAGFLNELVAASAPAANAHVAPSLNRGCSGDAAWTLAQANREGTVSLGS